MNLKTWTTRERWSLSLLLGLAALLRFYSLGTQPFWSDEYFSFRCISQPTLFQNILHTLIADIYPPLYYVLTWCVTRFNQSEAYLRFWSATGSVAAVGMIFMLARRFFGLGAAWAASLLACFSPIGVYYAQEFKLYSLFAAANLWVLYEFLLVSEESKRPLKRLILATAASMYTYYLSPYLLFPLFIVAILRAFQGESEARQALKGLLYGMLWALPLLPFFLKSILVFQGPDYLLDVWELPWYTIQNFSLGFWALPVLAEVVSALFCLAVLLNLGRKKKEWRILGPVLLFAVLPSLVNWMISLALKPNYSDRALLASAYAWVMAVGLGLSLLRPIPRVLAMILFLALQASVLQPYYRDFTRYNFRPAYDAIKALSVPGDAVFHNADESLFPFKYYSHLDGGKVPQWHEMEDPGFVKSQVAAGMRRYWRPINEWLRTRNLGINAGAEESWVWGERLNDSLRGVRRIWMIDASAEVRAICWKPWLHLARHHFIASSQTIFDPKQASWLAERGFKLKNVIRLAPGMQAWRYEKNQ